MSLQDFLESMKEIFEDAEPESIGPEAKFREICGYSSLVAFLIISMANEDYNVYFTSDDLRKANTIGDIFSIIKSKK